MMRLVCLAGLIAAASSANPDTDEVTSLPGWTDPFRSKRYSGYLNGSDPTRHISYFFVESESSPSLSPTVLWLNGGPGCSSLIGAYLEQGPLSMNGDGTLSENPGRWNMNANVLFIESPPGVGFSYIDGAPLPYTANDTTTSADSLAALNDFFSSFPAFASTPLFLSGESYAGIYVPWLAQAILASPHTSLIAQLRGILVGNGALKTSDEYEGVLVSQRTLHAFNHGLYSSSTRAKILGTCLNWTAPRDPACDALLAQAQAEAGPLNAYDIQVTCSPGVLQRRALLSINSQADPCAVADEALTAYMNQPDVQAALHVVKGAGVIGKWSECQSGSVTYTRIPVDQTKTVYPGLLDKISVLIYNGDQDE